MKQAEQLIVLIKALAYLVGLGLLFLIASFILPMFFTSGVGDWSDGSYQQNPSLLLPDQMRSSYVLGFISALYIVIQAALVLRFTKGLIHKDRIVLLLVSTAMAVLFAMWIGSYFMAEIRSQSVIY